MPGPVGTETDTKRPRSPLNIILKFRERGCPSGLNFVCARAPPRKIELVRPWPRYPIIGYKLRRGLI